MEERSHSDSVVAGYLPELPSAGALIRELRETGEKLQKATDELTKWGLLLGEYGPKVELASARLMLQAPDAVMNLGIPKPTVAEKEAWVLTQLQKDVEKAEQAGTMVKIYSKVVDSLKAQLNAAQSVSKAFREELDFVRRGPQWGP